VGRALVFTNSNSVLLGRRKKSVKREFVVGANAIRFVTIGIAAILAVVYLSQSTAGASRSVKIREFESQKSALMLEKERLEAEQTRLKSLKEIDSGVEKQVMEPVTSVEH